MDPSSPYQKVGGFIGTTTLGEGNTQSTRPPNLGDIAPIGECARTAPLGRAIKEHSYTLAHRTVMCPEGDAAARSYCRFPDAAK